MIRYTMIELLLLLLLLLTLTCKGTPIQHIRREYNEYRKYNGHRDMENESQLQQLQTYKHDPGQWVAGGVRLLR